MLHACPIFKFMICPDAFDSILYVQISLFAFPVSLPLVRLRFAYLLDRDFSKSVNIFRKGHP